MKEVLLLCCGLPLVIRQTARDKSGNEITVLRIAPHRSDYTRIEANCIRTTCPRCHSPHNLPLNVTCVTFSDISKLEGALHAG